MLMLSHAAVLGALHVCARRPSRRSQGDIRGNRAGSRLLGAAAAAAAGTALAGGTTEALSPGWDGFPGLSSGSISWSVPAGARDFSVHYVLSGAAAGQEHMVGMHQEDLVGPQPFGGGTATLGTLPARITREGHTSKVADITFGFLSTDGSGAADAQFPFTGVGAGVYNVQFHVRDGGMPGCPTTSCNAIYRTGTTFALDLVRFSIPGASAFWGADGNFSDSVGTGAVTPVGNVGFRSGHFREGFDLDGSDYLRIADPDAGGLAFPSGFTVAAWIDQDTIIDTASIINLRTAANASGFTLEPLYQAPGTLLFAVNTTGMAEGFSTLTADGLAAGRLTWVAATFDAASHTMQLYRDGVLVAARSDVPNGDMVLTGAETLELGHNIVSDAKFDGLLDDVLYFDRALSTSDLIAIFGDTIYYDGFND